MIATPTDLAVLSHRIREEWGQTRNHQVAAWAGYFNIGELLMAARDKLAGDLEYGRWFKEQDFGFTRQWGGRLIECARNRPALEAALETAVSGGHPTPGVNALLGTLLDLREQPTDEPPPPLVYEPDHHGSVMVDIIVNYKVGPTRRTPGAAHGSGPDRLEWACEFPMQLDAPVSLMDAQPFAVELAQHFLQRLQERPLETMKRH